MTYHPVTKKITALLKSNNCWFETFEHEEVRTSEEAAKVRTGYSLSQGAKAIIVRAAKSKLDYRFLMLIVPGDKRFDTKKVKRLLKVGDIRFATQEEVDKITDGIQFGGVPPFGNLFGLEIIVDPLLFDNKKIVFNAGDRRFSVGMFSDDFRRIVKPQIENIS